MRQHTIAILLLSCAFALASFAQDQPAPAQNPQMPATQTQTMPDQNVPAQTTTQTTTTTTTTPAPQAVPAQPVPDQTSTPALPASDQSAIASSAPIDQSAISQNLMQAERDSWENAKAKNASYFNSLPSDVTASLPGGATENKDQLAESVRKHGVSDFNLSNMNVTFPSADRAEVTYGASFTSHGKSQTAQVASEWQRDAAGNWQNIRVDFR